MGDAFFHASCSVEATMGASCSDVLAEMQARVNGQHSLWHDPHNNGTYAISSQENQQLLVTRTSGSKSVGGKKYTDKVLFTFVDADGGCSVDACSESQVTSVMDFSTNYCNIRNLYCGSADGCKPVTHDFANAEKVVRPSIGAGKDRSACVVAADATESTDTKEPALAPALLASHASLDALAAAAPRCP